MRAGVAHDSQMTLQMSFSALPTSPEFDAIHWREGRIDLGAPVGESPALIAEFDLDNDNRPELVVKSGFMQ
jgi:hypothetical protein